MPSTLVACLLAASRLDKPLLQLANTLYSSNNLSLVCCAGHYRVSGVSLQDIWAPISPSIPPRIRFHCKIKDDPWAGTSVKALIDPRDLTL